MSVRTVVALVVAVVATAARRRRCQLQANVSIAAECGAMEGHTTRTSAVQLSNQIGGTG